MYDHIKQINLSFPVRRAGVNRNGRHISRRCRSRKHRAFTDPRSVGFVIKNVTVPFVVSNSQQTEEFAQTNKLTNQGLR